MIGVELHFPCGQVRNDLVFKHSIFTGSAGNKYTIRLLPPLNITQVEADLFMDGFVQAVKNYESAAIPNS